METDPCCGDAWGDLIEILSRRSTAEAEETLQLAESAFREPSMRMAKGCPDWATFYVLARVRTLIVEQLPPPDAIATSSFRQNSRFLFLPKQRLPLPAKTAASSSRQNSGFLFLPLKRFSAFAPFVVLLLTAILFCPHTVLPTFVTVAVPRNVLSQNIHGCGQDQGVRCWLPVVCRLVWWL